MGFDASSSSTLAVLVRVPHDAPPDVVLVAPTSLIVYVVLTPNERLAADRDGGELEIVTVGVFAAVALELVATVKLKVVAEAGLVALKPTDTVAPAATPDEQEVLLNVITVPDAALLALPPLWRQLPETSVTPLAVAATLLLVVESPIVIVPPDAMADGDTNVTV